MVQALILAGGKSTRMKSEIPKVLLEVQGRSMIRRIVENVQAFSPKPILVVGFQAQMVQDHMQETCEYVLQSPQMGTGHAVMCAKEKLAQIPADQVLVLYGDQPLISKETMQSLIEGQKESGAAFSIATVVTPHFDGVFEAYQVYGRIVRTEAGGVVKIVEVKDATEEEKNIQEVNTGIYCFDKTWLLDHLDQLSTNNAQGEYYLTDLLHIAVGEGKSVHPVLMHTPEEGLGANTQKQLKILEQFI